MKVDLSTIGLAGLAMTFCVNGQQEKVQKVQSVQATESVCSQNFAHGSERDLVVYDSYTNQYGEKLPGCEIRVGGNRAFISKSAADPSQLTLAATMLKNIPPVNITAAQAAYPDLSNPAEALCKVLGGSEPGFFSPSLSYQDSTGQTDVCTLGDGSAVSGWTLFYTSMSNFQKFEGFQDIRNGVQDSQVYGSINYLDTDIFFKKLLQVPCTTDDECGDARPCGSATSVCGAEGYCVPTETPCRRASQCNGVAALATDLDNNIYCVDTECSSEGVCVSVL